MIEIDPPVSSIGTTQAFQTDAVANSALASIYIQMISDQGSMMFSNGGLSIYAGLSSDEIVSFMGILQASGMSDAIANSLLNIIPESWGLFYGLIVAIISVPGTYFLNNDAFYYGVMPVLAEAGLTYGFTPLQLTFASLMGQAFHLLSPLVPFVYVLLGMTEVEMGAWQKKAGLISVGIFLTYVLVGALMGLMPIFIG